MHKLLVEKFQLENIDIVLTAKDNLVSNLGIIAYLQLFQLQQKTTSETCGSEWENVTGGTA